MGFFSLSHGKGSHTHAAINPHTKVFSGIRDHLPSCENKLSLKFVAFFQQSK